MTGTEIIKEGVKTLRKRGFVVRVFNNRKRATTRDWVDVWACKAGISWLIEVKGDGDALRPGQKKFAEQLQQHLGDHLRYRLARSVEDFKAIALL